MHVIVYLMPDVSGAKYAHPKRGGADERSPRIHAEAMMLEVAV